MIDFGIDRKCALPQDRIMQSKSKILNKYFLPFFISFLVVPLALIPVHTRAATQDNPGVVVQEILDRLKKEEDPSVILDYVHWPSAWKSFPQSQRDQMGISSEEDFKSYFETFFQEPEEFVQKYVLARYKNSDTKLSDESLERMADMMKRKKDEIKQKMKNTTYALGDISTQGNAATVEVKSTLDGKTKTQTLPLQSIDGKWYLPTMKFLEENQTGQTGRVGAVQ